MNIVWLTLNSRRVQTCKLVKRNLPVLRVTSFLSGNTRDVVPVLYLVSFLSLFLYLRCYDNFSTQDYKVVLSPNAFYEMRQLLRVYVWKIYCVVFLIVKQEN